MRNGLLRLMASVAPMAAMIIALATISTCLYMWRGGPSFIEGVYLPAISELSVEMPQKRVYQVGFALCACLLSLSTLFLEQLLEPHVLLAKADAFLSAGTDVRIVGKAEDLPEDTAGTLDRFDADKGRWVVILEGDKRMHIKNENIKRGRSDPLELWADCVRWGHIAAAGVAHFGIFTFQKVRGPTSYLHFGGAVLFLAAAMKHAQKSNELYDAAAQRGVPLVLTLGVRVARKLRHLILDYSSFVVFLIVLGMQGLNRFAEDATPGSNSTAVANSTAIGKDGKIEKPPDLKTLNMIGLMQWAIIFQFAIYFCSYTLDMRAAADVILSADAKSHDNNSKKEK